MRSAAFAHRVRTPSASSLSFDEDWTANMADHEPAARLTMTPEGEPELITARMLLNQLFDRMIVDLEVEPTTPPEEDPTDYCLESTPPRAPSRFCYRRELPQHVPQTCRPDSAGSVDDGLNDAIDSTTKVAELELSAAPSSPSLKRRAEYMSEYYTYYAPVASTQVRKRRRLSDEFYNFVAAETLIGFLQEAL